MRILFVMGGEPRILIYVGLSLLSVLGLFLSVHIFNNIHAAPATFKVCFGIISMVLFVGLAGYYNFKARVALALVRAKANKPLFIKVF